MGLVDLTGLCVSVCCDGRTRVIRKHKKQRGLMNSELIDPECECYLVFVTACFRWIIDGWSFILTVTVVTYDFPPDFSFFSFIQILIALLERNIFLETSLSVLKSWSEIAHHCVFHFLGACFSPLMSQHIVKTAEQLIIWTLWPDTVT